MNTAIAKHSFSPNSSGTEIINENEIRIDPVKNQFSSEASGMTEKLKVCITDPELFSELLQHSTFDLISKAVHVELITGKSFTDKIFAIVQSQPQVIVHNSIGSFDDDRLIHTIKNALPDTCCITLGNTSSFLFRIRSIASGANHILDRVKGLRQVVSIFHSMHFLEALK